MLKTTTKALLFTRQHVSDGSCQRHHIHISELPNISWICHRCPHLLSDSAFLFSRQFQSDAEIFGLETDTGYHLQDSQNIRVDLLPHLRDISHHQSSRLGFVYALGVHNVWLLGWNVLLYQQLRLERWAQYQIQAYWWMIFLYKHSISHYWRIIIYR